MLPFSAVTRAGDLQRMAEREVDLLVIGGGITGCGVALDAASRGYSVALVERTDFAAGTSGRSSRLIHGGVRYLEHYDFGVVHESLRERAILLRLAPHLVRPFRIYAPSRSKGQRALFRLGLGVYDVLAAGRNIGVDRLASAGEIGRAAPGLGHPTRGVTYLECRTDDARLTVEVARAARRFDARVANHAPVERLLVDQSGSVVGAVVTDDLTGERLEVRARLTVNAAGVWADRIQAMATDAPRLLEPSKGVHLVFRPGAIGIRTGMLVPSAAGDRRFLFVVPWGDRVYAGTTDTPYDGPIDEPQVTEEDRDYIVGAMAQAFPGVTRSDVVAEWAGLRPLLGGTEERHPGGPSPTVDIALPHRVSSTADLSRRHAVYENPPGLLTITGGKLTAYRSMAEDAVDRASRRLGKRARCWTRRISLGFSGELPLELGRAAAAAEREGLPPDAGRRMVMRFGDDWAEALRRIVRDPELGEPVADGLPVLAVELELARVREMAIDDEDALVRRTRLTTMDARLAPLPSA
jgi:glycerol-3-phosphate dehydrogenase